jgi:hypothetical protein
LEKLVTVYGTQRSELNKLTNKLDGLPLEETEQAEAERLRNMLDFESILKATMEVLKDTVKELYSRKDDGLIP